MAINPLVPISKTLGVVKYTAGLTQRTLRGMSGILSEKDRDRKTISSSIKILKQRRIQDTKRKNTQEIISAPTVVTRYRGPALLAQRSDNTSFTSRIMGFLGYLAAGWALRNLPTWVAIGDQLIRRIGETGSVMTKFGSTIQNFIFDIGGLFNAAFSNLKQFDFTDSSGRLKSSLDDLSGTIMTMGNQLEEALSILTKPFLDIPPIGSRSQKPSAYDKKPEQPTPPGGQPTGGGPDFWILSLISHYESLNPQGAADVAQSIYNRMGYSGRTARQEILAKGQYEPVTKFGGYSAWNKVVDRETAIAHIKKYPGNGTSVSGLDKVTSALTNKSIQQSASKFIGNRPDFRSQGHERKYNDMTNDITRNGQTFGFNRGSSYVGKSTSAANVPDFGLNPPVAKPKPTTPGKIPTSVIDEINVAGPSGGTRRVGRSGGRGEYLARGGRHKGIDIGTSGQKGYYVSLGQTGKVTYSGWNDGGYGYLVIIRSGNLEFFFAHLAKISVKNGAPYNGETIGEIGNTGRSSGIHLHFEVRIDGGGPINPEPYLKFLSIGTQFTAISGKPTQPPQPLTPLVGSDSTTVRIGNEEIQIDSASITTFSKLLENLTTEQKGRKVVVIDDRKPSSPPMIFSAGGGDILSSGVSEFTLVNNFMKNKLLLDLTYL
jgi:murein DD-endopeptidase MepM/ murein hydrolase activator NlpD